MQTTTTVDLEAEQAKRTQKAREGTWDIVELSPGHFRVSSQTSASSDFDELSRVVEPSNGQQTCEVFYDPAEEWRCTCKDFSFWGDKGIRCKHCEAVRLSSPPYPVMVLRNFNLAGAEGVKVRFSDEAEVFLSIRGRYPCSACGDRACHHFRLAVPYFARWKWETAQSPDCSWGPTLLQSIGIIPPYIVRPDLVTKQSRWAPFGRGEEIAPGVRVWHTVKGKLFRFSDNGTEGHVYVGSDHPDGHTPCLICQDGCDHMERALALRQDFGETSSSSVETLSQAAQDRALAQEDTPLPGAVKEEEAGAPKTQLSDREEVTDVGFMDDEFRPDQAFAGTPSYPWLQWVHGDPRMAAAGGVLHKGGFAIPKDRLDGQQLAMPEGELVHGGGRSTPCYFAEELSLAILAERFNWERYADGQTEPLDEYQPGAHGRYRALVLVKELGDAQRTPFMLTLRGTASRDFMAIVREYREKVLAPASRLKGQPLPHYAFYVTVKAGDFETVGQSGRESRVTLPVADIPEPAADREGLLAQLSACYVGSEARARCETWYDEAVAWADSTPLVDYPDNGHGPAGEAEAAGQPKAEADDGNGPAGKGETPRPKAQSGNGRPASEGQLRAISNLLTQRGWKTTEEQQAVIRQVGYDPDDLTADQAADIIQRVQAKIGQAK